MDSVYYEAATYWALFVNITVALATVGLFWLGKASNSVLLIVGLTFVAGISFLHWGLGGEQVFPKDISGERFFFIILAIASGLSGLLFFGDSSISSNLNQSQLQLVLALRTFVGIGFMVQGFLGVLPLWLGVLDGITHLASGLSALVAALAFSRQSANSRSLLWLTNLIGLTDILVLVVSLCFFAWPQVGPHHNMNYILIGAGPIVLWLHFVSVQKLVLMPSSNPTTAQES